VAATPAERDSTRGIQDSGKAMEPDVRNTGRKVLCVAPAQADRVAHISELQPKKHVVELGREIHADIDFWRWAIEQKNFSPPENPNRVVFRTSSTTAEEEVPVRR